MSNYGKAEQRHFATLNLVHKESFLGSKVKFTLRQRARFQLTVDESFISQKRTSCKILFSICLTYKASRPSNSQENELLRRTKINLLFPCK